jgi:hypothetical protein
MIKNVINVKDSIYNNNTKIKNNNKEINNKINNTNKNININNNNNNKGVIMENCIKYVLYVINRMKKKKNVQLKKKNNM